MTMNQRCLLITVIVVKCHSQDPRVGEITSVWVRIPFSYVEFLYSS